MVSEIAGLEGPGFQQQTNLAALYAATEGGAPGPDTTRAGRGAVDSLNIRRFGAALDGSLDDAAKIQALYDSAPNNSVIDVPIGRWPMISGAPFSPRKTDGYKSVLWRMLGTVDLGADALPGTRPVDVVGDDDLTESFSGGHLNLMRSVKTGNPGHTSLFLGLDNYSHSYVADPQFHLYPGFAALQVNAHSHPGSNGTLGGIGVNLFSGGSNPYSSEDQGLSVNVRKYGQNSTWGISTQTVDTTGRPPQAFATIGQEMDLVANGQDDPASLFDPSRGNRRMLLLVAKPLAVPARASGQHYETGAVVSAISPDGVKGIYIAATGGVTAGSPPREWPHSGAIPDGTVTWRYSEDYTPSIGMGIFLGAQEHGVTYNSGLATDATFGNSVIDLSKALLATHRSAGIRLARDMPVDFSGDGTAAGQNVRILEFSSAAAALTYAVNGVVALSISDSGLSSFPGQIRAPLVTPKTSSSPCVTGTRTADANYEYVCVATNTWKRAALSAF